MRVSAMALRARSGQFRQDIPDEVPKCGLRRRRPSSLDPLLAEAHDALGMAYARDGQWEQSERSFRRAIELDPGPLGVARSFRHYLLLPLGRIEEALRQLRAAEKADPLSPSSFYLA